MSRVRALASSVLRTAFRYAPRNSRDWVTAMLAELDYIESDWAALFWAIGSTTAIFRHSIRGWREWFVKSSVGKENAMPNGTGNRTVGILMGAGIAGMLVVCAFGLVDLLFHLFPKWDLGPMPWWMVVIVIPEIIFVLSIVLLWRKRRPMALGILLTAIILVTHFAVHIATHFH
jgi:hypothetical protein